MRNLIKDFTNHPLLPGSVIVSIMDANGLSEEPEHGEEALAAANRSSFESLVSSRLENGRLSSDQAERLLRANDDFIRAFSLLETKIPEI
ncbi:hypothetical protein OAH36_03490, partial [Verrucomicrobia bacterium]|nr:hypothetical protein [Verrucomicrobiota bacterium]